MFYHFDRTALAGQSQTESFLVGKNYLGLRQAAMMFPRTGEIPRASEPSGTKRAFTHIKSREKWALPPPSFQSGNAAQTFEVVHEAEFNLIAKSQRFI